MNKAAKNLLVYADGRTRSLKQELLGHSFIELDEVNGDWWRREFDVHPVHGGAPGEDWTHGVFSMVGIERSYVMTMTAAESDRRDAERRAATMRKVLWGIENYPGDDEADDGDE